ncbi:MAG: hypothetical protein Q4C34_09840, partial [Bacteroidales bacterium]|nr:hypothetical protein [Bacteroidales bacterium]
MLQSSTVFQKVLGIVGVWCMAALHCTGASATTPSHHPGTDQVSVSENYYRNFKFTWTDASGTTHESNLAERATDPAHIVALLSEVYLNP